MKQQGIDTGTVSDYTRDVKKKVSILEDTEDQLNADYVLWHNQIKFESLKNVSSKTPRR